MRAPCNDVDHDLEAPLRELAVDALALGAIYRRRLGIDGTDTRARSSPASYAGFAEYSAKTCASVSLGRSPVNA